MSRIFNRNMWTWTEAIKLADKAKVKLYGRKSDKFVQVSLDRIYEWDMDK